MGGKVVGELDVEPRLVRLDHVIFNNHGFFVALGEDNLHIGKHTVEQGHKGAGVGAGKITAEAIAEVFRFADIENFPLGVFHQIDAWPGWCVGKNRGDVAV